MQSDVFEKLSAIRRAIEALRIPLTESEYQLHALIAAALRDGGFVVQHEAPIAPRCRVDFLVDGVGVEVKRGKPTGGGSWSSAAAIWRATRWRRSSSWSTRA